MRWTRRRRTSTCLTVSAENAEDAAAEVTVTVLNSEALRARVRGSRLGVRGIGGLLPSTVRLRAPPKALITSTRGRRAAVRRTRTCSALRTVPRRRFEVPDALDRDDDVRVPA